jgi:hypothetical protein
MRFYTQLWSNTTFILNGSKTVFDESKSFFGPCLAIFWLSFLNILHLQQVGGAKNDLVCQWVLFYPENNLVGHYMVIS